MEEEYSVYWRTTFPDQETQSTTVEEEAPNFIGQYLEDMDGNRIAKSDIDVNDEFYLYIETEFSEGETISIDLKDNSKDYEYNGKYMKDDIIKNITITGDLTKVKLKAIEEQN